MIKLLRLSAVFVIYLGIFSSIVTINLYAQDPDAPLTQEQINEVEKNALKIKGCSDRVGLKFDPGKLCDSFTSYLRDKCDRLDYLSDYCGPLVEYLPKKVIQKNCIANPPQINDTQRIDSFDGIRRCPCGSRRSCKL